MENPKVVSKNIERYSPPRHKVLLFKKPEGFLHLESIFYKTWRSSNINVMAASQNSSADKISSPFIVKLNLIFLNFKSKKIVFLVLSFLERFSNNNK